MKTLIWPTFMADPARGCATTDPELFFPDSGDRGLAAKAICARCPFTAPCRDYARGNDVHGVWGGETRHERQQHLKKGGDR